MSSFQLGPFEVRDMIASGGMGDVWSGVHVAQDVAVAIKVLKQQRTDDSYSHDVFRREARAVAQLNHPGIISLFDVGDVPEETATASGGEIERGNPYLVMEFLERGSLDSLEYPLPWPPARKILIAVLEGLAHAHARGITHRDLKPGNVLLADEASGSPIRLTDFGLAFGYRGNLMTEEEGMAAGTPSYMAPEQFIAEWRDFRPWTDLYSLGCVAYELASGRVPFSGDLLAVGMAHIEKPPPPLTCPPDYPAGFDSWVMKLLEKDPMLRYQRSAEAAAALASLSSTATTPRRESQVVIEPDESAAAPAESPDGIADWRSPAPPPRPFKLIGAGLKLFGLRTVPMVGRATERDIMWRALERVSRRAKPEVLLLEGGAGVGKSRLAEWFCQRAHEMGLVDYLKAEHNDTRGMEFGLSDMLASAWSCIRLTADELQGRVNRLLASAGVDSPALQRAITEFVAPAALGDSYSPGLFYEFRSPRARFSTMYETLRQVYSERPLVIWLDDVHWGADALQFAHYVLDQAQTEAARMIVVLTARDDLLTESSEASIAFYELGRRESVQHIQLGSLPDADNRRLVNSLLYLAGDLAERVGQRSGGNPLYATQLVGDWVERGILRPGGSGFVLAGRTQPEIPDDIHTVWVRRLERVLDSGAVATDGPSGAVAQRIQMQVELELAAALGGRVNMAEWISLCALAGAPDPHLVLEPLLDSRLARAQDDGWSFSHSMLRDTIERIAREKGRWASHNRLCADALEQRHPIPNWGDSERIGRYRFEARQYDAAIGPLFRGAKERKRIEEYSASLTILTLYTEALDQIGAAIEDPRRIDGWLLRAEINLTRGELDAAEELAHRVTALAGSANTQRFIGSALLVLAQVHRFQGKMRTALEEFLEAQRILRVTGPTQVLAACLSDQANAMMELDLLDEAWDAFNEAQQIYEENHQLIPWAENQLGLARVALRQGDPQHCTTLCRRVLAFASRENLSRVESAAWLVLSEAEVTENRLDDAEISLDRSIALLEQLGLTGQTYYPRLLKTLLLLESGASDRASVEFSVLRTRPETHVPRVSQVVASCVALAVAAEGPARQFQSTLDRSKTLLANTEVVTTDVVRSLLLAIERSEQSGFPDRAALVKELAALS